MKIAALISGGKDSLYALYLAKLAGHKPVVLISMASKNPESYMFHTANIDLVKKQAEKIGLPLIFHKTKGVKEEELEDLKTSIKAAKESYKIEGVVSGALASTYQRSRIDNICKVLKLKSIAPLWHKDQLQHLKDLIKAKFESIITAVASRGLDESWLGRKINPSAIKDLEDLNKRFGLNIAGEGGEYETFVLDCPLFKSPLKVKNIEKIWEGDSGRLELTI